jgi:hypothetical protein
MARLITTIERANSLNARISGRGFLILQQLTACRDWSLQAATVPHVDEGALVVGHLREVAADKIWLVSFMEYDFRIR